MLLATVISSLLARMERKWKGSELLFISVLPSWFIGCCCMLVEQLLLPGSMPVEMVGAIGASGVLLAIFFLDVGR